MPVRGGGQGPAQISWSTFDFGLLNLDNLKKGEGVRLCPNFMEHFNVRFLNSGIFGILFLLTNV